MTTLRSPIVLLIAACATTTAAPAHRSADAPPPVVTTITALLGADATVSSEVEDGAVVFEGAARTSIEIEVDGSGQLIATEVAIPPGVLPAPVAAAVTQRGRVTEAEVILLPTGVAFEVEVATDRGTIELMLDATGAVTGEQTDDDGPDDDDDEGDHD